LNPPRKDTTKPKVIWTLAFEKAFIQNSTFRYFNGGREALDFMAFNPSNIRFEKISGNFEKLKVMSDSLSFLINDLSTTEHSGFTIEHFESKARIHSKGLEFDELKIITPNSSIGNTA